jgi:hypothetical protein
LSSWPPAVGIWDEIIKGRLLGVEPGTTVRSNPGSWKRISDPQDLIIFNQARKKCSPFLFSQEGRLKSHPSFTSLLQNAYFMGKAGTVCQLKNKITVILVEPVHTEDVLMKHILRETMVRKGQMNIQRTRKAQETILEAAVQAGLDMEAPVKLALLQNEIAQGEFSANVEVPIVLNDSQKTQFRNEWRNYRERNENLIKHRGQAFSLIQGQCTQLLQYKMKQDTDWAVVSTS